MFDTEKFIGEIEACPPLYDVQSKDYSNREVKAKCRSQVAKTMYEDWEDSELTAKEKDELVKELMKKWKSLRDCFMRDHRSATATGTGKAACSKKRYVFYDQLQFILPYVKGNTQTSSNIHSSTPQKSSNVTDKQDLCTTAQNVVNDSEHTDTQSVQSVNYMNEPETSQLNSIPTKKTGTKRKFENTNVAAGNRTAIERSVASSTKELTNILSANLAMQREERISDKFGHKAFLSSFVPVLDNIPLHEAMLLGGQIAEIFTNYFGRQETPNRSRSAMSNTSFSAPQTPATVTDSELSDDFCISDYINLN